MVLEPKEFLKSGPFCFVRSKQGAHKEQESQAKTKALGSRRSFRKERISCFFVLHGFSFFRLDLVDCLHQCFNIQVGVDTFGERHGTGVSHNLLDHGLIHMGFC